jgi:type IV secretory pathway TrbL component
VPTSVIVQPDNARVIGYVWPNSAQALSRFLNIQPFPALLSVSASPNVIKGGNSTTGSVRIATPAITGGARVTLSDNNTALETPASVTIPAGQSVQSFTLNSIVVATSQNVTVTAQLGSVTRTTLVTVDP